MHCHCRLLLIFFLFFLLFNLSLAASSLVIWCKSSITKCPRKNPMNRQAVSKPINDKFSIEYCEDSQINDTIRFEVEKLNFAEQFFFFLFFRFSEWSEWSEWIIKSKLERLMKESLFVRDSSPEMSPRKCLRGNLFAGNHLTCAKAIGEFHLFQFCRKSEYRISIHKIRSFDNISIKNRKIEYYLFAFKRTILCSLELISL